MYLLFHLLGSCNVIIGLPDESDKGKKEEFVVLERKWIAEDTPREAFHRTDFENI